MFGNIRAYRQLAKDYLFSRRETKAWPGCFGDVAAYCMFIGYPRSSHSLIGSLIDAHPDAIIAHEQDVLKYVKYGFSKEQIFHLLVRNSREFTQKGRTWTGYSYAVEGQFQGEYRQLKVIGDKRGANSARRFRRNPGVLAKLRGRIALPVKMIHVMRNPYDNISTMAYRNNGSDKAKISKAHLAKEIGHYFDLVETVDAVRRTIGPEGVIDIRIEAFMSKPKTDLERVCGFLGLEAEEGYLDACAAIVYNKPHRTRYDFPWDDELIAEVEKRMEAYPFFEGYAFND